jgi:membrane protease YdiL (CAAX protease family)
MEGLKTMANHKKQLAVFYSLLLVYVLLIFITYAFVFDQAMASAPVPIQKLPYPTWVYGLMNGGIILVLYGGFGLAGYWFARKLGLPGIYREGAGWGGLILQPLWIGLILGVIIIIGDRIFALIGGGQGFPHPAFPFSMIASASAGIGEEILFRGFVLTFWALLFHFILKKWNAQKTSLWVGNIIAALAFGAGHLPSIMYLNNVSSPAALTTPTLLAVFLLNGILGLIAGERQMKNGLVAAMGIHFWADVLWHVVWPLAGV